MGAKGIPRRRWVKLDVHGWLRGSIRRDYRKSLDRMMLGMAVRDALSGLICMAGDSAYGNDGFIQQSEDVGLTDEQYAGVLVMPLDFWLRGKAELVRSKRIRTNTLTVGYGIEIMNWRTYQPDYTRQRKYRASNRKRPLLRPELQQDKEEDKSYKASDVTEGQAKAQHNGPDTPKQGWLRVLHKYVDHEEETGHGTAEDD